MYVIRGEWSMGVAVKYKTIKIPASFRLIIISVSNKIIICRPNTISRPTSIDIILFSINFNTFKITSVVLKEECFYYLSLENSFTCKNRVRNYRECRFAWASYQHDNSCFN